MLQRISALPATLLLLAANAAAGGFFLSIHAPDPKVADRDAILTVEAQGCQDYSQAHVTGTAEGTVDGKRRSIALELAATGRPGAYMVRRQWPERGKWVLVFHSVAWGRTTSTIVSLAPDGRLPPDSAPSQGIRMMMRPVNSEDIEAALR